MPKGEHPTIKQRQFVREYLENGGNGTQAALAVYDANNDNTAKAIASENLTKPTVREEIARVMAEIGFNSDYVVKKHFALMDSDDEKIAVSALREWYAVTGAYAPKRAESVRVTATLEDIIEQRKKRYSQIPDNTAPIQ